MAALKPWYKIDGLTPDLREGKPLDASEFAVHLDKVRDETAPPSYKFSCLLTYTNFNNEHPNSNPTTNSSAL